MLLRSLLVFLLAVCAPAAEFAPLIPFDKTTNELEIVSLCVPGRPFTVAGEHGAILGRQNGRFEAWQWPVKILSDFRMRAELAEYAVPIDVNALAAEIRVTPTETLITYSHSAFTIWQHMFAARGEENPSLGAAVFFEIQAARPLEITFSFTPEMLRMWPAANFGRPNGEWVSKGKQGFYMLHTDNPQVAAIVAMPGSRPGIQVPYQEHPQTYPLEFKLSFDPKQNHHIYPLVMALGSESATLEQAAAMSNAVPDMFARTQAYYAHFFDKRLTVDTPDRRVNEGLRWAEVAIDQAQVSYGDETGLIAGYYESADSARPGYAWFFGRDTLWTTYALNSYGEYALTKKALEFLFQRQRADGKVMHEFSQAASLVDWKKTPYFYASADSTPLLLMAMCDYVRTSGDQDFLKQHWEALRKAWQFTRAHQADDGIYSNSEGTGWVESWPPGMPKEEIYLAAVDKQAAEAMSRLAAWMKDGELSSDAYKKAGEIANRIESEYYVAEDDFYAFSRTNEDTLDRTATIYPAVAWWDGTFGLKKADGMLKRWASSEFSTDWGTRDISIDTSFYDPISYHQGTVWPLFTGWVSLAEYRAGRPLSGYSHLMQNLNLTWAQDLGSVTELLSGEFFQPLGRSSSHQLWSSAMIITPLLRGLFGLDWNAVNHTLRVAPQLPADWERAHIEHLALGKTEIDLDFERSGGKLQVRARSVKPEFFCLTSQSEVEDPCKGSPSVIHSLTLAMKPIELSIPAVLPEEGAVTSQLKVVAEEFRDNQATITLAAMGKAAYDLPVRMNRSKVKVSGGQMNSGKLHVEFPDGAGYQTKSIGFTW